jgi:rubrerythrin
MSDAKIEDVLRDLAKDQPDDLDNFIMEEAADTIGALRREVEAAARFGEATLDALRAENEALRGEQNELCDDVKNLTASVDSVLAIVAARDATIEDLRAALEEKVLDVIEARNPGIDRERVRRDRAAALLGGRLEAPCQECGGVRYDWTVEPPRPCPSCGTGNEEGSDGGS